MIINQRKQCGTENNEKPTNILDILHIILCITMVCKACSDSQTLENQEEKLIFKTIKFICIQLAAEHVFPPLKIMNSNFETNEKRSETESPRYRWTPKSSLQNPHMRREWESRGEFCSRKQLRCLWSVRGHGYLFVKALHQIIRSSPFMFSLWKEKRWNRKSGINQRSFSWPYVSASAHKMKSFLSQFRGRAVQLWEL